MFSSFKNYINQKEVLSEEDWKLIESFAVIKKLRKHQYLLEQGDIWTYDAFVCEGCLRRYNIDEKGVEHTIQFSIENWWAGDRESLLNGTPSKFNITALENSQLILFHKDHFEIMCRKIPAFSRVINAILQKSMTTQQQRIHAYISMSAQEKFVHFSESYPKIVNRVPRKMLASYLGMTAETLSRVIKNALEK